MNKFKRIQYFKLKNMEKYIDEYTKYTWIIMRKIIIIFSYIECCSLIINGRSKCCWEYSEKMKSIIVWIKKSKLQKKKFTAVFHLLNMKYFLNDLLKSEIGENL